MANGMMGNPMGAQQPPMEQPMNTPMGGAEDAVLDMHLTEDVKKALSAKGIDVSAVADRGPKEPVVVIPVSIIMNKYQGASPEESMKQFVQDMTANAQAPATEPMPQPAMAEAPPSPEGLGAPTMDRPPMTA
jgi:pyruvate/2-oxoglutarate dehydrogenase complex dihydrolipoamide acyltransferase (E2) component